MQIEKEDLVEIQENKRTDRKVQQKNKKSTSYSI
jgi:hypothetical protein